MALKLLLGLARGGARRALGGGGRPGLSVRGDAGRSLAEVVIRRKRRRLRPDCTLTSSYSLCPCLPCITHPFSPARPRASALSPSTSPVSPSPSLSVAPASLPLDPPRNQLLAFRSLLLLCSSYTSSYSSALVEDVVAGEEAEGRK